jgi:cysteine desulfurase
MEPATQKAVIAYFNKGNPSASYASAKDARTMMRKFREYIGELCGFNACCAESRDSEDHTGLAAAQRDEDRYKVIFTSGASESNAAALRSIVEAYTDYRGVIPHVVMGAVEHKSLLAMAESFEERGRISLTLVAPRLGGHIHPDDVAAAIQRDTCVVCVMAANNETGALNDIAAIGRVCHARNVPFHCDAVQSFGKYLINPLAANVDSFSVSFHKFGGPPGIGMLVVKQKLLAGYNLEPLIYGSQNEGLRGGTENLPGIAGAFAATRLAMQKRAEKNRAMGKLRQTIVDSLAARFATRDYASYYRALHSGAAMPTEEIVFIGGSGGTATQYLHNTILLSVVKRPHPAVGRFKYVCNSEMKKRLEEFGIIVSIGSACNTASPKASHVLYAMKADEYIRKGALRISLGDNNTATEVKKFLEVFEFVVAEQFDK